MTDIVVFDLDSTIADTTHRQHMTPRKQRERGVEGWTWTDYSMLCAEDALIEGMKALINLLRASGNKVFILSGRNDEAGELSRAWLLEHNVHFDLLRLRPSIYNDRPVPEWKVAQLQRWQSKGYSIKLFIDDWPEVCEAVERECQIPVLCVQPPKDGLPGH